MCIEPAAAIVFLCRAKGDGSVTDPSGLAGVKNKTQEGFFFLFCFSHLSEAASEHVLV